MNNNNLHTGGVLFRENFNKAIKLENSAGVRVNTNVAGYHQQNTQGLFIAQTKTTGETLLLVHSLNESLHIADVSYNLSTHKFKNGFYPHGVKYISGYRLGPTPEISYAMGAILLKKKYKVCKDDQRLCIHYFLQESYDDIELEIRPFLAYRKLGDLCKCRPETGIDIEQIENGIAVSTSDNSPDLYFQSNKTMNFRPLSVWYYNFAYNSPNSEEDTCEDLYVPGSLHFKLQEGDSLILSIALSQVDPLLLQELQI